MEFQSRHQDSNTADQTLADDRRTSVRYPCDIPCQPMARSCGSSWRARAVDISATGIALVLDRRFEQGAILSIRLESPDGQTIRNLLLRVVYTKAQDDSSWRVGCAFGTQLREHELQAF